jgi:hypothetical protein
MFTRKSTIVLLSATLLASVGFAADVAEPETPGSAGPKAVAEAIHNARIHGTSSVAPQLIAQAPGSRKAQAVPRAFTCRGSTATSTTPPTSASCAKLPGCNADPGNASTSF